MATAVGRRTKVRALGSERLREALVGYGFIAYAVIKLISGRPRDVHVLMYITAAAVAAYFIWGKV